MLEFIYALSMYDFVYTTDLGEILLLYRQDRHRIRWSELRPTPAKLVVYRGGITAGGLYVSWDSTRILKYQFNSKQIIRILQPIIIMICFDAFVSARAYTEINLGGGKICAKRKNFFCPPLGASRGGAKFEL